MSGYLFLFVSKNGTTLSDLMLPIKDHNRFLLTEKRAEPKEYFKFLMRIAGEKLNRPDVTVADVGCGGGDFLLFLRHNIQTLV